MNEYEKLVAQLATRIFCASQGGCAMKHAVRKAVFIVCESQSQWQASGGPVREVTPAG